MTMLNSLVLTADDTDFKAFIEEPTDTAAVKPASEYVDEVMVRLFNPPTASGAVMPWTKTYDKVQFRPGEVTLWLGVNGHGKSMVTSHTTMDFLFQDEKVCIASFEMKPAATMARMVRQVTTVAQPRRPQVEGFLRFCQGRLWLYDQQGSVDWKNLLGIIRYSASKLGVKHFVVDSLMKCVRGEDDYNGQKDFVDALCNAAKDFNLHIHLVHHIRKLQDEHTVPGKMDAKGSGAITDQVDQVISVWRNKRKEHKRQTGASDFDPKEPDQLLIVDKNRHGEWEGRIGLYFFPQAQAYSESQMAPKSYDFSEYIEDGSVPL